MFKTQSFFIYLKSDKCYIIKKRYYKNREKNHSRGQIVFKQETKAMAVSYKKLLKLLIDKKIKKKELCELAGVSASTIGKWVAENLFPLKW